MDQGHQQVLTLRKLRAEAGEGEGGVEEEGETEGEEREEQIREDIERRHLPCIDSIGSFRLGGDQTSVCRGVHELKTSKPRIKIQHSTFIIILAPTPVTPPQLPFSRRVQPARAIHSGGESATQLDPEDWLAISKACD